MITARNLMTQPVITVSDTDTIHDAIELMLRNSISGLPVVGSQGEVLGMLTEGDLLRRAEIGTDRVRPHWLAFLIGPGRLADEYTHTHSQKVADVMSTSVVHAAPDATLESLVALMQAKHIKRIPILEHDCLVGMVGRSDLLRAVSAAYVDTADKSRPDSEIKARLWSELNSTQWAPCNTIRVDVADGAVTLGGIISDGRERNAMCAAAAAVPGVKHVYDHMTWVDLNSGTVIDDGVDRVHHR
jgi:CBS domain-containing protein